MTSVTSIDNEATEVTNDSTMEDESFTTNDFHPDEGEELQRKYLNMIKMCDVLEVQKLLENNSGFDLNCKNYQGITGLNLAIEANCEPMIDLLLSRTGLEIGDSLMRAIRHNHYPIVIKLLDLLQVKSPERAMLGYEHSAEFPQYLTPIMLAAQCGHYQIISLLLERGHTIPIPHKARCLCKEVCKSLAQLNSGLEASELKLSVFRALSNPFYIYLTSEDPILTAFQLSKQLVEHGNVNRLFKSDYESLNLQTRVFAVDLIGLCRSSREVKLILTRKEGCNFFGSFPYHRLVMAMDLKQKEFVAHGSVQQILEVAWAGNWYMWRDRWSNTSAWAVLFRVPLLLWILFLNLFAPYSKNSDYYSLPVNRMINYLASYAVFLVVLTWANNLEKAATDCLDDKLGLVLKVIIVVYAVTFILRTIKLVMVQSPWRFFSMLWNIYDCVKLCMLAATVMCWWSSYLQPRDPPIERKYWTSLHPTLVGEGLLAVVTVMSYLRLLFLCQLSYSLGPLQVSLGKMTTDFARLVAVFGIIIVSFTAGLCRFYQYYAGMTRVDPITGYETKQDESFVNVYSTLKTLFWGMFCMTSSTAGTVVIENPPAEDGEDVSPVNNHYITQAVGTLLYSVFQTLSVIVTLNMLIATMTNTFQRVTGNSYVEWVFGRTEVFLSFSMHSDLPPPLNIIPTIRCTGDGFKWLVSCCKASSMGLVNMVSSKKYYADTFSENKAFHELMHTLSRRYLRLQKQPADVKKCFTTCN
ncbi:hypothetical protein QTP88_021476 [Uroleucon formosanum]